jgi:diguanylate cyclase (GGDEF)-like protein
MKLTTIYPEGVILLFEGSLRVIPFNIILALLLTIDLLYNKAPLQLVILWMGAIIISTVCRWFFCRYVINKKLFTSDSYILAYFVLLTLFMGSVWGVCYWLMLPYISTLQEFIIILVFGGMSAGSIASLSVYLPAYYAYIFPMFLPVIAYNYLVFETDRAILATMFLLFVIMVLISSRINNLLLNRVFSLSREKEALIDNLHRLSISDALTGLYNRRYFESVLQNEYEKAQRNHYSLALVSIDIDNFKLINDNFGHPYGDDFLIFIAELLKNTFRRVNDMIFRIGGDEFSIILLNQSIKEALNICNEFNDQFNKTKPQEQSILQDITLSMGIVSVQFNYHLTIESLINSADEALYQAKKEGKNKMIVREFLS